MPSPLICVPGTWAYENDQWHVRGASLIVHLQSEGLQPLPLDNEPFDWTENAGGLFYQSLFNGALRDWEAGAEALRWYVHAKYPPGPDGKLVPVSLLTHSHGGQVAAFAAAQGLLIDVAITLACPVRRDLLSQYHALRQAANRWIDVYAHEPLSAGMPWQKLGSRFNRRDNPLAAPYHLDVGELSHRGTLGVDDPWRKYRLARAYKDPNWIPPGGWTLAA